jgi:hypothetical protein
LKTRPLTRRYKSDGGGLVYVGIVRDMKVAMVEAVLVYLPLRRDVGNLGSTTEKLSGNLQNLDLTVIQ